MSEEQQKKLRTREKNWWNDQLRKAHLDQGMKYPAGGIIGNKHTVTAKALCLEEHLKANDWEEDS